MEKVDESVKAVDSPGVLAQAKNIAQVDSITKALEGHIEKLSSLVSGLVVCQSTIAFRADLLNLTKCHALRLHLHSPP